jgi:hypothetical protein
MQLVAASAFGSDQPGILQHVQVLGYRLAGRPDAVPHGQTAADLEQRLRILLSQLVEDLATGRVGQGLEDITHDAQLMQVVACLSMDRLRKIDQNVDPGSRRDVTTDQ